MSVFQRTVFQPNVFQVGTITPPTGLRWSSLDTWQQLIGARRFPTLADVVNVPAPLILDVADAACLDLVCHANVTVAPGFRGRLQVGRNLVTHMGDFIVNPDVGDLLVHWPQVNEAGMTGGAFATHVMDPSPTDPGIWNVHQGALNVRGPQFVPIARLAQSAQSGTDTIILDRAVDWSPGDPVVLVASEPPNVPNNWDHDEIVTVRDVSGTTVRFTTTLRFDHLLCVFRDGLTYRPAVCRRTAAVRFTGRPGARPHHMTGSSRPQTLEYAMIQWFGPRGRVQDSNLRGLIGRYPDHFHLVDRASVGSVRRGVIICDSGNGGGVDHGSDGILREDCVLHDITVPSYTFPHPQTGANQVELEHGGLGWDRTQRADQSSGLLHDSNDLVWRRVVASRIRRDPGSGGTSGFTCGFLLGEGDRNILEDCDASGAWSGGDATGYAPGVRWPPGASARGKGVWPTRGTIWSHNNRRGVSWWENDPAVITHPQLGIVCFWNNGEDLDLGAYGNSVQFIDARSKGNLRGTAVHAQSRPPQFNPPSGFTGGLVEGDQLTDYCEVWLDHNPTATTPRVHRGREYTGYRIAAIWFGRAHTNPGVAGVPHRGDYINPILERGPDTFCRWDNRSAPSSLIRVQTNNAALASFAGGSAFEMRPNVGGNPGTVIGVWNCRVTPIPNFTT